MILKISTNLEKVSLFLFSKCEKITTFFPGRCCCLPQDCSRRHQDGGQKIENIDKINQTQSVIIINITINRQRRERSNCDFLYDGVLILQTLALQILQTVMITECLVSLRRKHILSCMPNISQVSTLSFQSQLLMQEYFMSY